MPMLLGVCQPRAVALKAKGTAHVVRVSQSIITVCKPDRRRLLVGQPGVALGTGPVHLPLRAGTRVRVASRDVDLESQAEQFVRQLEESAEDGREALESRLRDLRASLEAKASEAARLQGQIDALYANCFNGVEVVLKSTGSTEKVELGVNAETQFGDLGRSNAELVQALLQLKEDTDAAGWLSFQSQVNNLKLQRSRLEREIGDLSSIIAATEREVEHSRQQDGDDEAQPRQLISKDTVNIVLVSGFESFNVDLYAKAARQIRKNYPFINLQVFSDRDISGSRSRVEAALAKADVFFGSLLFDFDQVEWLRAKIQAVPVRLVFESALELMSCTQVGSFQMASADKPGASKGPPPVVKKVLSLFGSQREEDKLVGYLSFLKVGPKLLKFIPGKKARDLRNWLTIYSYWNQGGLDNVSNMVAYIVQEYFKPLELSLSAPVETPATGCVHPLHQGYFSTPSQYMQWYKVHGPVKDATAPVVALMLYRKHVITNQSYIPQLIQEMEAGGVIPLPVFINGVEAHTIVRDKLTSTHEQQLLQDKTYAAGWKPDSNAVPVDAVVNTIGFPLVGGPAGTMEGGRQADIAKAILSVKNIPYIVAAPMLIQDMESWTRDGIAGLQSVVLYSLPELDGAIDTVPLGGLCGDNIYLVPERVKRLVARINKWVQLRRKPAAERKVAVLLYGFPPGVGATGTAALLNVPRSLQALLTAMAAEGYDLGALDPTTGPPLDGEALITALKLQEDQRLLSRGAGAIKAAGAGPAEQYGVHPAAAEVSAQHLKDMLTYPADWGPSEWGPIPFLPSHDILVKRMEKQWGDLRSYRGLSTSAAGNYVVPGVQLGNVWVGVQPLLGIEGDPMRLLFERDLTPHPQYAAFYQWLQHDLQADAVLHFGMHGTVEWLPGAPLGNTGFSWSDVLLGNMPNVYVYACNNPSESIIAKRRGYGTIVSHNVPPYGRAGLYKQLAVLKDLLAEFREDPTTNSALRGPIIDALNSTGLQEDCPFQPAAVEQGQAAVQLTVQEAEALDPPVFEEYCSRLYTYLQVVENRLFSEGLHVLGAPPSPSQMAQYLAAYFGDDLPAAAVDAVSSLPDAPPGGSPAGEAGEDGRLAAVRAQLEKLYQQSPGSGGAGESGAGGGAAAAAAAAGGVGKASGVDEEKLAEALRIRDLLARNTEELQGVLRALRGEYILPEAGGDLLRDGAGVLPTGRNIHALDPYRMPSLAALERGSAAAEAILSDHRRRNGGAWPETVAVNLWGLDAIKTKGESVAMVLHMVGAVPVREGTGRIARFELLPLDQLGGRPRVDVLCNMSGIFRDSFQNVVELLDDLFRRAAEADEPQDMNYVRKHAAQMAAKGIDNASARLFSNPAGDYGSMVNERVGQSNWDSGTELGDTWASRNAFSYGRGAERGTARPEVLQSLLSTTDRVVQEIDSVEYGLTDIQEYYANTGALKQAAQTARGGRPVGVSIVEAFGKDVKPKELEDVLRLEYRSKLLNPRWADAMASQGSGGAFEISQRMTAMVGWGATVEFQEDWVWDQAAETYALDEDMAARLRQANPQAFSNVLKRMLEAAGRGMWNAQPEVLERLQRMYADLDDELEGVAK